MMESVQPECLVLNCGFSPLGFHFPDWQFPAEERVVEKGKGFAREERGEVGWIPFSSAVSSPSIRRVFPLKSVLLAVVVVVVVVGWSISA